MTNSFEADVRAGLSAEQKHLSSKYFYDDNGSRIFQEIMNMPEYYPTDAEFEILAMQSKAIFEALDFSQPFNIIELGAGDGFKTYKLLEYLVNENINFNYVPIDISQQAIDSLTKRLSERLPGLNIKPRTGDYFHVLKEEKHSEIPSLLLFLGGNIGNYHPDEADELLKLFHNNMNEGDKLLIGIDLKKNPLIIHKAYFDPHGITKRFNLNLLLRMNRELGADFKVDDFDFYCHYNPITGDVKSYIVSLRAQKVHFKAMDFTVDFDYNELIWTELSKKYDFEGIDSMASRSGFEIQENFLDCKHYFTDSLWVR
ncbi:L-histidine N(alpha)-methyltransferase [Winogradskyella maritima]|uniref:L-histidine N(Alpha)-methyltransferase n=1 Tax=Winogradskyella maritima TaxID=1517766 RepID=A0ABV8AFD8_9FLAO|nr:L-histidine N(alpha)-methyltransferase [Winogradskyella maritima]